MCHGSLTVGLVGLKNPQYDLWGNTVDVACQMESMGVLGRIQVSTVSIQCYNLF